MFRTRQTESVADADTSAGAGPAAAATAVAAAEQQAHAEATQTAGRPMVKPAGAALPPRSHARYAAHRAEMLVETSRDARLAQAREHALPRVDAVSWETKRREQARADDMLRRVHAELVREIAAAVARKPPVFAKHPTEDDPHTVSPYIHTAQLSAAVKLFPYLTFVVNSQALQALEHDVIVACTTPEGLIPLALFQVACDLAPVPGMCVRIIDALPASFKRDFTAQLGISLQEPAGPLPTRNPFAVVNKFVNLALPFGKLHDLLAVGEGAGAGAGAGAAASADDGAHGDGDSAFEDFLLHGMGGLNMTGASHAPKFGARRRTIHGTHLSWGRLR